MVKHDCAKHIIHEQWGPGTCIEGEHTIVETSEGEGYVTHYDIMFEHGIELNVPVEDIRVVVSEMHGHTPRKKMKEQVENVDEGLGKTLAAGALALGIGAGASASMGNDKPVHYQVQKIGNDYNVYHKNNVGGKVHFSSKNKDDAMNWAMQKEEVEQVNKKLTPVQKAGIQRALGSKRPDNKMRQSSSPARELIDLVKKHGKKDS